jgi:hypothetical protein
MALPKKVIPNINLVPPKILLERREQLLEDITKDGTYLPKNLGYAEMDRGFLDFVKNELKTVVEGKVIPTVDILITTQNWAQFTQTWSFQDLNGNTEPPFITVVRVPEVKYGTNPATLYNIPNQKEFFYAAVPTWNGNVKGLDIYKIPQPVPVDISFSVKIICNRMRELNEFNKNVLQTFASRQAYTKVNGHFIPIVNTNISDESVTQLDKRRFYIQNYDFTLLGFLLDQDKFEVAPAVSRVLNVFETNFKPINRKRKLFPVNEGVFDLTVQAVRNSPVVRTISVDYTGTFTILSTQNVSSYDLFVRLNNSVDFDFYGTNVINFEVNTGDQLRFEITQENADPTSTITYGVSLLGSPQNLTFDLPTPSITPTNTITPSITPTTSQTPSITPSPSSSNTSTPSVTPTMTMTPTSTFVGCDSMEMICYEYQINNTSSSPQPLLLIYSACTQQITVQSVTLSQGQTTNFCAVAYTIVVADTYTINQLTTCGTVCPSFNNIFIHIPNLPTPSITPTNTITPSITPTNTITPSITPSTTPTNTRTPKQTPTNTKTPTVTNTMTPTKDDCPVGSGRTLCTTYEYTAVGPFRIQFYDCDSNGVYRDVTYTSSSETHQVVVCSYSTPFVVPFSNFYNLQTYTCGYKCLPPPPSPTPSTSPDSCSFPLEKYTCRNYTLSGPSLTFFTYRPCSAPYRLELLEFTGGTQTICSQTRPIAQNTSTATVTTGNSCGSFCDSIEIVYINMTT